MEEKKETKKFVKIQSTMNIRVTSGLQHNDVTNPDAHVADRLKISASWPTTIVFIKEGVHLYPSEVATWNTVKALERDKILSIAGFTDETDDDDKDVEKQKEELVKNLEAFEKKPSKKLADIAKEE